MMVQESSAPVAVWRLQTAPWLPGALAIFQLRGDVSAALSRLGLRDVPIGAIALRTIRGVDRGVVSRVAPALALFTVHGGPEVIRRMSETLAAAGIVADASADPRSRFPEAGSFLRAAMLDALSRAASPLAVDLLLAQPRLWAEWGCRDPTPLEAAPDPLHSATLDRLVAPPLVVAVGASNIGKSTLLNRLAGRGVAIVADEPGTTRDHVGALVDLAGLVVRYIDTPGLRPDAPPSERAAAEMAFVALEGADLVLLLGDCAQPPPGAGTKVGTPTPTLRVSLRADLGRPAWEADEVVSAVVGTGIDDLARHVRKVLVPDAALEARTPWRFWPQPVS